MSIETKILTYLQENQGRWVSKIELEDNREEFGCLAETVGRKCRNLARKNFHILKDTNNKVVEYKYINL